jgi:hypothetical protein
LLPRRCAPRPEKVGRAGLPTLPLDKPALQVLSCGHGEETEDHSGSPGLHWAGCKHGRQGARREVRQENTHEMGEAGRQAAEERKTTLTRHGELQPVIDQLNRMTDAHRGRLTGTLRSPVRRTFSAEVHSRPQGRKLDRGTCESRHAAQVETPAPRLGETKRIGFTAPTRYEQPSSCAGPLEAHNVRSVLQMKAHITHIRKVWVSVFKCLGAFLLDQLVGIRKLDTML